MCRACFSEDHEVRDCPFILYSGNVKPSAPGETTKSYAAAAVLSGPRPTVPDQEQIRAQEKRAQERRAQTESAKKKAEDAVKEIHLTGDRRSEDMMIARGVMMTAAEDVLTSVTEDVAILVMMSVMTEMAEMTVVPRDDRDVRDRKLRHRVRDSSRERPCEEDRDRGWSRSDDRRRDRGRGSYNYDKKVNLT